MFSYSTSWAEPVFIHNTCSRRIHWCAWEPIRTEEFCELRKRENSKQMTSQKLWINITNRLQWPSVWPTWKWHDSDHVFILICWSITRDLGVKLCSYILTFRSASTGVHENLQRHYGWRDLWTLKMRMIWKFELVKLIKKTRISRIWFCWYSHTSWWKY